MKKLGNIAVGFVLVLTIIYGCGTGQQPADVEKAHDTSVVLGNRAPIFDNDFAQVIKVTLNPGEALPPHEGKSRLIYSLSDYTLNWQAEGETPVVRNWKKGDVHVHQMGMLTLKNTGSTKAEWIAFARKSDSLPAVVSGYKGQNEVALIGTFARQVYDDSQFLVTEIRLAAGESIPMHMGPHRVIYSMSDYTIRNTTNANIPGTEKSFKIGDVHWHSSDQHKLENIGTTEANFLIVAYK